VLDKPRFSLAAWLAVEVVIADDPQGDRHREFKQVQAAKVAHRMASGTHKRWQREVPASPQTGRLGKTAVEEMHVYPRSRGRVLWHIGRDLEKAAELLAAHRLDAHPCLQARSRSAWGRRRASLPRRRSGTKAVKITAGSNPTETIKIFLESRGMAVVDPEAEGLVARFAWRLDGRTYQRGSRAFIVKANNTRC
jgi:hypothetical protein